MNTTTILNRKICFALSIFLFSLAVDAIGKVNASIDEPVINTQLSFDAKIESDSVKNKVSTIDDEAPVFTTIPRNGFAASLEEVAFEYVMAVDNLSRVTITFSDEIDGSVISGILTRTWTATDQSGNSSTASAAVRYYGNDLVEQTEGLGSDLLLDQNYPNPFTKTTSVPFYLPSSGFVTLKIYDASGRSLFVNSDNFGAGDNKFDVNGADLQAEGVLYYELITAESKYTRKMLFNRQE